MKMYTGRSISSLELHQNNGKSSQSHCTERELTRYSPGNETKGQSEARTKIGLLSKCNDEITQMYESWQSQVSQSMSSRTCNKYQKRYNDQQSSHCCKQTWNHMFLEGKKHASSFPSKLVSASASFSFSSLNPSLFFQDDSRLYSAFFKDLKNRYFYASVRTKNKSVLQDI